MVSLVAGGELMNETWLGQRGDRGRRSGLCAALLLILAMMCFRPLSAANAAHSAGPGEIVWHSLDPRVVNATAPAPVNVTVRADGATAIRIEFFDGSGIDMVSEGDLFVASLPAEKLLVDYREGTGHNMVGRLVPYVGGTRGDVHNLNVNVLDRTMPAVSVNSVKRDTQVSTHVVNIRYDDLYLGSEVPPNVTREFYRSFPDRYDFLAVVEQVRSPHNRFPLIVRNDTEGIGLATFDNGKTYGSRNDLEGIIHYPIDSFYDLAETANLHEIGHRWAVYIRHHMLDPSSPHWPLSDLAHGIMGLASPSGAAFFFPWKLTEVVADRFACQYEPTRMFNDLELYLMGLLPPSEVSEHYVFHNDRQTCTDSSPILEGPTSRVRIDDLIASNGARVPRVADSPKHFRIATLVLSKDRLLTAEEMAFFDYMAARGEAVAPLPYASGFVNGTTYPFFVATGERATLSADIQG